MVKMAEVGTVASEPSSGSAVNNAVSVENDTSQDNVATGNFNPIRYLFIAVAILNNASAILGIPVVLKKLQHARKDFTVDLSMWKNACLLAIYKMATFTSQEITAGDVQMRALDSILEDKDVHETVKGFIEDGLRGVIFDLPGAPVATRARQLKKFRTLDGRLVIVLSCARFNQTLGRMLVVWDGEENPLPFILTKSELDFGWSRRGEKLSNTEFDKMIDLIERLLQGLPNSEMQPLPVSQSRKKDIRDKLLLVQNQEDEATAEDSDPPSDSADESSGNYSFLEMQGELGGSSVERGQQEEGPQMIRWFREAEHAGFLPEEVQAALFHCGDSNPVDWLKGNWQELVANVATQATEEGKKLRANIVGVITMQEAGEALRKQEGDIPKSIKECIDSRRKKFVQMMQYQDFEQDQVLTALQENDGDTEKAILAIQREQLRPFEEHIWRADENPQHVELKDGDFERNVRMLLCQFNLPSWESAEQAVKLIASGEFEFDDIIEAVRICEGLESCKKYLQCKSSSCPRFPMCDLPPALLSTMLSLFFRHAGDPQFATKSIYRKVMCMLLHALRDCTNKANCPVCQALTKAYADYVINGQNELEGLHQCVKTTLGQHLATFSLPQLLADEENITQHQAEMLLKIIEFTPAGYTEALEAVRGAGQTAELCEVLHRLNYPTND